MNELTTYNTSLEALEQAICDRLMKVINEHLPGAQPKIWHRHPVWFLEGNPVVGYSKEKRGIRLMFWSGADFGEEALHIRGGKFKDASIFYNNLSDMNDSDIKRWLGKAREIQWDYKNIVKRKGVLKKLKYSEKFVENGSSEFMEE